MPAARQFVPAFLVDSRSRLAIAIQEGVMTPLSKTALLAACLSLALGAPIIAGPALAAETAIAPEKNPPGDIPDDQVFVQYTSPLSFSIKVPEGWSRVDR